MRYLHFDILLELLLQNKNSMYVLFNPAVFFLDINHTPEVHPGPKAEARAENEQNNTRNRMKHIPAVEGCMAV